MLFTPWLRSIRNRHDWFIRRAGRRRNDPSNSQAAAVVERLEDRTLLASVSVGLSFTGTTFTDSGYIPPDTMGAVGPGEIVEIVNGRYAVYDKATGGLLESTTLDQFWTDTGANHLGNTFDPRVIYDQASGHWFAAAVDNGGAQAPNNFLLAVSLTSDPTLGWTGFRIDSDSDDLQWADFPTLGVDADGVYISANMIAIGTNPQETNVLSVPKADLVFGAPSVARRTLQEDLRANSGLTGIYQPAVDFGPSDGRAVMLSAGNPGFSNALQRTDVVGANSTNATLSTAFSINTTATARDPWYADQPGFAFNLDTGDNRFSGNVVEVGDDLWAVQTIRFPSTGNAAIQWYRIDETTNAILQSGTISDPNLDFYYPSIAANSLGTVVIGFSGSGPSQFVSTYAAIGETGGGQTVFDQPILLQQGVSTYDRRDNNFQNRWGDYSATVVDPVNPSTFWTFQEYVSATDEWAVEITELQTVPTDPTINADFLYGNGKNSGQADEYRIVRNGDLTELWLNGTLSFTFDATVLNTLTINGSQDDDHVIVDHSGGDPIPTSGLFFDGNAIEFPNHVLETEPNDTPSFAQDLTGFFSLSSEWSLSYDQNIEDSVRNISTTIPHVTVEGAGDDTADVYRIYVRQAGSRGIFDIDNTRSTLLPFDSQLSITDFSGSVLASNYRSYLYDTGSNTSRDAYLEYVFPSTGYYYIQIDQYTGTPTTPLGVPAGATYQLNISLENQPALGASNQDRIDVINGTFDSVDHAFDSNALSRSIQPPQYHDMSLTTGGVTSDIFYRSVETVNDQVLAGRKAFSGNSGTRAIDLDNTLVAGVSRVDPNLDVVVNFTVPQDVIEINAGTADNTTSINGIDATFRGQLSVDGGSGADRVLVNTPLSLGGVSLTAENLELLSDGITTTGSQTYDGSVTIGADTNLTGDTVTFTDTVDAKRVIQGTNYTRTSPRFHLDDISLVQKTATPSTPMQIGFDFPFYGVDYTTVYLGSYGYLSFLPNQSYYSSPSVLPDASSPNGIIAGWWGASTPTAKYGTIGLLGDRVFIVDVDSSEVSMQYKLFEKDGSIEIHYEQAGYNYSYYYGGGGIIYWNYGSSRTVGIESPTGVDGDTFYNSSGPFLPNIALGYRPDIAFPDTSLSVQSTGGDGSITFDGDVGAIRPLDSLTTNWSPTGQLREVEPNDDLAAPQDIDSAGWVLLPDASVGDTQNDTSTTIPHVSIQGNGNSSFDYYSFNVANDGDRGIFDVDFSSTTGLGSLDTELFLYDANGNLLDGNDNAAAITDGGLGSTSTDDAYLEYVFATAGTYIIGVAKYDSDGSTGGITGEALSLGDTYTLQVSLENHPLAVPGRTLLGADIVSDDGAITFNNPVELTSRATIKNTGLTDVVFANTVDGPFDLTLDVAGDTRFATAIGSRIPLGDGAGPALRVNSPGTTDILGTVNSASGLFQDATAGPITFHEDVAVNGGTASWLVGDIVFDEMTFASAVDATIGADASSALTLSGANRLEAADAAAMISVRATADGTTGLTTGGTGTTVLGAINTYTGSTQVVGGTLLVNGATSASSPVTVSGDGVLGGNGNVFGPVTVIENGSVNPGTSPGALTVDQLVFDATSGGPQEFTVEIDGNTPVSEYDQLIVTDRIDLGTDTTLNVVASIVPGPSTEYMIVVNDGLESVTGTFAGLAEGAVVSIAGIPATLSYQGGDGNDITLTTQDAPTVDLNGGDEPGIDFAAQYVEDDPPVGISDIDAVVDDPDSTDLVSATIVLTNVLDVGDETLAVDTTGTGITANYDGGTGILTLVGADSVANYQAVLRSLKYKNASQTPDGSDRVVTVTVNDGTFDSPVATATVSVVPVNEVPITVNESFTIDEGGSLTTTDADGLGTPADPSDNGVLANDSDPDGDPLSASLVSGPDHAASFTLNADGTFRYVHDGSEGATDSFVYSADDGTDSTQATVTINLNPINDAPVAVSDSYTVVIGDVLSVSDANGQTTPADPTDDGVLANDADPDGDAITATLVSPPTHAAAFTFNSDGTFDYTHDGLSTAQDSFTYLVNDGSIDGNTVTVTLTIEPYNEAPVNSIPVGQTTVEDTPLSFSAAQGNAISISDPDAGTNAVSVKLTASNGTLTATASGSAVVAGQGGAVLTVGGTIDDINTTLDGLLFTPTANYFGSASIEVLTDDLGATGAGGAQQDIDVIDIAVSADNDVPVANDDVYTVPEGGTLTAGDADGAGTPGIADDDGVIANDSDVDNDTLTATLLTPPLHHAGTFTLAPDGTFTYIHDGTETTSDSFTYLNNDGTADSNIATVSIQVASQNDAPVGDPDSFAVIEGGTLNVTAPGVLGNDSDIENDPMTAVLVDPPAHHSGPFVLNADGSFSYEHNGDEDATDTFTYKINDGTSDSSEITVTIGVTNVNDPPIAVPDNYVVVEGGSLTTTDVTGRVSPGDPLDDGVVANDVDAEGDTLTVQLVAPPAKAASFHLNSDGTFDYTHNGSEAQGDSFVYLVSDGMAISNWAVVSLRVAPQNDAPQAVDDWYGVERGGVIDTVDADGTSSATDPTDDGVLANDVDVDLPSDTLAASLVTGPTHAAAFTLRPNGTFLYVHDGSAALSDSFTYRPNDGTVDGNVATVHIEINAAPVAQDASWTIDEHLAEGTVIGTVAATDPNPNESLTFTITAGDPNDVFTIDPNTGDISINNADLLDFESTPSFQLTVEVADDGPVVQTDAASITIQLIDANETLVVSPADWIGNSLTVLRDGGMVRVVDAGGADVVPAHQFDHVDAINVTGGDGSDDLLTISWSNGSPIPAGGLTYDGGADGNDTLALVDGTAAVVEHSFQAADSGTIAVDGATISYTGLEPIVDVLTADHRVFGFGASDDTIQVTDFGAIDDDISVISSDYSESVQFLSPNVDLTIDGGDGDDVITLQSVDSQFAGDLIALGSLGSDVVDASVLDTLAIVNLKGGDGEDLLIAGPADASLDGGAGNDVLQAGEGLGTFVGGTGVDRILAVSDTDMLLTNTGITLGRGATQSLISIEEAELWGGDSANTLDASDFSGPVTIVGGAGDDVIEGGSSGDLLQGDAGDDLINAHQGDDVVLAGAGNDTVFGSAGRDLIDGGDGNDNLLGQGSSFDTLIGGPGRDTLSGGSGDDFVFEGPAATFTVTDTTLFNGVETDRLIDVERVKLTGDDGDNRLDATGFTGLAYLNGMGGNDTLLGGSGNDRLNGGLDDDLVVGGDGIDFLWGGAGMDRLLGNAGDDRINGQGGADLISGNEGNDRLRGGDGNDQLSESADVSFRLDDHQLVGLGTDEISGFETAALTGGDGDNTLDASGFHGRVVLDGGAGNDRLIGTSRTDTLSGGTGDDSLTSNGGNDVLDGASGTDRVIDEGNRNFTVTDTTIAGRGTATLTSVEIVQITGGDGANTLDAAGFTGTAVLIGGAGNDTLIGGSNDDWLDGQSGNDFIDGRRGDDSIIGGDGDDRLEGGDGADVISGGAGVDHVNGERGNDTLSGGSGNDKLLGGSGDDILMGDEGNDELIGHSDADTLAGGAGVDSITSDREDTIDDAFSVDIDVLLGSMP